MGNSMRVFGSRKGRPMNPKTSGIRSRETDPEKLVFDRRTPEGSYSKAGGKRSAAPGKAGVFIRP
jgi:hypothetical protein